MTKFLLILIVVFLTSSCDGEYEEAFSLAKEKPNRWICFYKKGINKGYYCIRRESNESIRRKENYEQLTSHGRSW